jgi:hypothetical protein
MLDSRYMLREQSRGDDFNNHPSNLKKIYNQLPVPMSTRGYQLCSERKNKKKLSLTRH